MHTKTAPQANESDSRFTRVSGLDAQRLQRRRQELDRAGFNASAWAREHGFKRSTVHGVLSGDRACRYGAAHRIAVLLGLKDGVIAEAETAAPALEAPAAA